MKTSTEFIMAGRIVYIFGRMQFFPFFVKVKTCLMNKILEDRYVNPYTDFGFKMLLGRR